jgi:hypothetical protein
MREAQERQKVPLTSEEQRRHKMIERSFHDKQAALERQSFKYLDIFEQQMRE